MADRRLHLTVEEAAAAREANRLSKARARAADQAYVDRENEKRRAKYQADQDAKNVVRAAEAKKLEEAKAAREAERCACPPSLHATVGGALLSHSQGQSLHALRQCPR